MWLIGAMLVLALAAVIGWLNAGNELQLQSALVLADVTTTGCDGAGQVHLLLGNAADRPMQKVTGVLSVAGPGTDQPTPVGNFEITGPIAPGQKVEACAAVDETLLAGRDRGSLDWLARATAVEFGEPGGN
jgi:hypothetical protein